MYKISEKKTLKMYFLFIHCTLLSTSGIIILFYFNSVHFMFWPHGEHPSNSDVLRGRLFDFLPTLPWHTLGLQFSRGLRDGVCVKKDWPGSFGQAAGGRVLQRAPQPPLALQQPALKCPPPPILVEHLPPKVAPDRVRGSFIQWCVPMHWWSSLQALAPLLQGESPYHSPTCSQLPYGRLMTVPYNGNLGGGE